MSLKHIISLVILSAIAGPIVSADSFDVIEADNVETLASMAQIDFSQLAGLALEPASGIFVMSQDASTIITFGNERNASPLSTAIVWDGITGEWRATFAVGENPYDRFLSPDGETLLIGRRGHIAAFEVSTGAESTVLDAPDWTFLDVWQTPEAVICGETQPNAEGVAWILCNDERDPVALFGEGEQDFVRIGRIPAPLGVTVDDDFNAQLWNRELAQPLMSVAAPDFAVFGSINVDGSTYSNGTGSHLAWRAPPSQTLYLLDFTNGENHLIDELDGSFIAHILLSRHADVVFAIDPMSSRRAVWAWNTETLERTILGTFRTCNRQQPDLALLSHDGTTLVIGCDLGLDIWRVQ